MSQNGNLTVKRVAVESLHQDPSNARTHDERNVAAIQASLKTFGQVEPLVVQKGTGRIIGGNGRLDAIKNLGQSEVDVVEVECDDMTATALGIALNRTTDLSAFDDDILAGHLKALADADFDELVTGFDMKEIEALISGAAGEVVEDEVPEPPADPITKPGDLWVLGDHRVLCGDATKAEDVARVMGGEKADLVFTDPPYGVDIQERDMAQAEVRGRRKDGKGVANDDLTGDALREFLSAAFSNALAQTSPGACWYVCAPSGVDYRHPLNLLADLGVARHGIVWVKDRFVMGRADYHYQHESIVYGWTPGGAHRAVPTRDQSTVWEFTRPGASPEHPTMKPVGLVSKAIANSSARPGIVFDPFLGSGTTLIAAEQLGRRCYGLEIEPRYVDVVIQRWENLTGKKAERTHLETADGSV